jgi:O-antigen/teichoic acid export membrane protein
VIGRRRRAEATELAPEQDVPSGVVAGGILLTVATFASIASNYLFQVLAGRILGPSEYSLLGSLFTLIGVVTIAASALQAACAKEVVTDVLIPAHPSGRGKVRRPLPTVLMSDPLVRRTGAIGLIAAGCTMAASPAIAAFLDATAFDIVAFALLLPSIALVAIVFGRLQGLERFVAYAVLGLAMGLGKLLFGVAAIAMGLGVTGGLFVLVAVSAVGALFGVWYSQEGGPTALDVVKRDVWRAFFAIGVFTLMISIDVPIARHFFASAEAGRFAAAAVVGHGVMWLPEVIAIVAFPEMVKARATRHDEHRLLLKSAGLALVLCLVGVVVLYLAGPTLFDAFYGDKYQGAADLSWKIGLATVPYAIANLFVYDHLAGKRIRFIVFISVCAALQAIGFLVFHSSSTQYVAVVATTGVLLLVLLTPWQRVRAARPIRVASDQRLQTVPSATMNAGDR